MDSPPLRRRLQGIVICVTASFLFLFSISTTLAGFLGWHALTTRPHHVLPLHFFYSNSTPITLTAYAPLPTRGLRAVQELTTSVRLLLPESDANLENSVFRLSAQLFGLAESDSSEDVCLAQGSAQASLRFRSPVHRAIRAVIMLVPLLLGLTHEYQTVDVKLLRYRATADEDGRLPALDAIRVEINSNQVQVAKATMTLRVKRRAFLTVMLKERRLSTFVVVTVVMWYCMLLGVAVLAAVISVIQRVLSRAWSRFGDEGDEENTEESRRSVAGMISGALPPRFGEVGNAKGRTTTSSSMSSSITDTGLRRRGKSSRQSNG